VFVNVLRVLSVGGLALLFLQAKVSAAPPTAEEARAAFTIFLNAREDIVQRCIYRPSGRDVVFGALNALSWELGPEYASFFPVDDGKKDPEAWQIFQQTLTRLAQAPKMKLSLKALVERSLRAYCRSLDRYSDYDDLETWQQEIRMKQADYSGVGMSIERTPEGYDCHPFPGGPADLAGCDAGDRLIEVESKPVRGLNAVEVASLIVGKEGTKVRIKVRHRNDGVEEMLTVTREKIRSSFIEVEQDSAGATVRLRRLTDATVRDLRSFLRTLKKGGQLTLDLRGCQGGDLSAAVAIASLFLPKGAVIGRLETLSGKEPFHSSNDAPFQPGKLIIIQDRSTMSGAELLTVALVSSPQVRAESRGEKSYGKGVTIAEVAVENGGGRLRITDARIYGPKDEFWDGEGLSPLVENVAVPD
jgi:carboxyl-terminal processing protease